MPAAAAPAGALAGNVWTIVIIAGIAFLIIVIIIGGNALWRFMAPACVLVPQRIARDVCSGACGPGMTCVPTSWKPYARNWLAAQPATCGCGVAAVPIPAGLKGAGSFGVYPAPAAPPPPPPPPAGNPGD
jgi:hypothetical protein